MIERLYVHNFRCLENFSLDLTGKPSSLLIGKNGAGKSTVLHALRVLQKIGRGPNRVKNIVSANDFSRHDKDLPMRFEVDLNLKGRKFKYSVSFEWPTNFYEARISEENLTIDGGNVFTRKQAEVQLAGTPGFGLDWHVFALPVVNERGPAHSIQDVRTFFGGLVLLAPVPQQMTGFSEEPVTELDWHATNYASCLRAMLQQKPKAYSYFDEFLKQFIPDFSSIENVDRGKEGGSQLVVTFEHSESGKTLQLNFDDLSDGEKCFFLSAYISAANAVGLSLVCAWDEPDNHLSLSEVGQFIMTLRKMASSGGQIIATSHHVETIRGFSDENTFVLTRKSHLDPTVVKPLSAYSRTGDLIHSLIRGEIIG